MINKTYKKEEVLNMVSGFQLISQNNKRTIWRKDGVQVTATYWDIITAPYWEVKVKKIS